MNNNKYRFIILTFMAVLLLSFYGCSTGRDGDKIIHDDIVIKGTTTSYATDKGTIILVSSNDPQVIVEAKEENTLPSGAAIVLVERALYLSEVGAYGGDSTNVYVLTGTYLENGIEKKLTETDKPVTLSIPNIFSSEYYEFILGYKEINADDWQYIKLGEGGKAVVGSARFSADRTSPFIVSTRHIGYCYTIFGVKPESKKFDDINSITFCADPAKYEVNDNNEYTEDLKVFSLIEAEKTTSMFTASDLTSELTFYTTSPDKSGILVDGKTASESVSYEKEFNGAYLHRISINNYTEANLAKSGNLATYSVALGIKGISKNAFPPEFHFKSTITTNNRVVFVGEGKLTRSAHGENTKGLPIDAAMTAPATDTAVSVKTPIVLAFSEGIDWSTKAKKLISLRDEYKVNISYTATISSDYKTLTITPDEPLSYGKLHVIDIEEGITGSKGINFVKPVSFKFMTEAGAAVNARIEPVSHTKFDDYYIRKPEFVINFGKSVADVGTVKKSIRVLLGGQVVEYAINFTDAKNSIASLTFPDELLPGQSYSISMTNSIMDTEGLEIGVFEPLSFDIFKDAEVVETTPADGAENVLVNSNINIRISCPVNLGISSAKNFFSVKDAVTGAEFPFDCSYDEVYSVMSIVPRENFLFNRRYQVIVKDGFVDSQTLQKLGSYSFYFNTADSDYIIASLNAVEGYHQKNTLPFVVFRENPKMEIDFMKDLADYSYASKTISILKDGIAVDWQKSWDGNRLILTPPGNMLDNGSVYKISMTDVVTAKDNSFVNPFVPQEFKAALLDGKGIPDNPFRIYTAEDFEVMRVYRGSTFMLMNNIDFSEVTDFEPVGSKQLVFFGKLYGNGKTISNLGILGEGEAEDIGLFGDIYNAQIASLTLDENCFVIGYGYIGGIVGNANESSIEYCLNKATISGCHDFAGICGRAVDTTFLGCKNNGEVKADFASYGTSCWDMAGITANAVNCNFLKCVNEHEFNVVDARVSLIGGIVGVAEGGEITDCKNTANLTGYYQMGGIAGTFKNGKISNCKNSGDISATISSGDAHIAGIVGNTDYSIIEKCRNSGNISLVSSVSASYTGGIAGRFHSGCTFMDCCNTGTITGKQWTGGVIGRGYLDATIKNCCNIADVKGMTNVGGIIGSFDYSGGVFENCYCVGNISGSSKLAGIIGNINNDGGADISNCYFRGNVETVSSSITSLAAIVSYSSNSSGKLCNCFSTTDTKVRGSFLTTSSSLKYSGAATEYNNYVFDVSQLAANGYDTVIKGAAWGEGSTWNNEDIWNFYPNKLPELKNMPE